MRRCADRASEHDAPSAGLDRVDRVHEQCGHERNRQRHQPHAAHWREPDQRAVGELRIAGGEPRESGEQIAAQPFGKHECARGGQQARKAVRSGPADRDPAGERRVERQERDEPGNRDRGQRSRHSAKRLQRYEQPRHAGAEQARRRTRSRATPRPALAVRDAKARTAAPASGSATRPSRTAHSRTPSTPRRARRGPGLASVRRRIAGGKRRRRPVS